MVDDTATDITSEIAVLNELIAKHIGEHVTNVDIRFDAPNAQETPTTPTLHLFMYLIHEDLSIRQSMQSSYNPQAAAYDTPYARIRCLYLATYWESSSGDSTSPDTQASSQTILKLTETLRALLCMRRHNDFKNYQIRVIEPEALNSLGNFWQALDNKPRAIINFAVTLPVSIVHPNSNAEAGPPILETLMQSTQQTGASLEKLEQLLFNRLVVAMGNTSTARMQLAKVAVHAAPLPASADASVQNMQVIVSGVVLSANLSALSTAITAWSGESLQLDGQTLLLSEVTNTLAGVTPTPPTA
ncbi:Pvc16 family protein [Kosakonia cowanii]|uniref:Pvc16 family protein n=1 Tax=Kosakonia cowanii TaxID=208223 RepID=UPI0028A6B6DF|nr:Pvc16 family protein [Kosakonia cowanii]